MKKRLSTLVCFVAALSAASAALAEDLRTDTRDVPPRFELGGGVGAVWIQYDSGGAEWFPTLQGRINLSRRFAIDVAVQFEPMTERGVYGLYALQVHQGVGAIARSSHGFVTYGVAGEFEYYSASESRYTYPTGDTVVYPAYRHGEISAPLGLIGGGGYRFRLASRLALEVSAQAVVPFQVLLPVPVFGARFVVPIGK